MLSIFAAKIFSELEFLISLLPDLLCLIMKDFGDFIEFIEGTKVLE